MFKYYTSDLALLALNWFFSNIDRIHTSFQLYIFMTLNELRYCSLNTATWLISIVAYLRMNATNEDTKLLSALVETIPNFRQTEVNFSNLVSTCTFPKVMEKSLFVKDFPFLEMKIPLLILEAQDTIDYLTEHNFKPFILSQKLKQKLKVAQFYQRMAIKFNLWPMKITITKQGTNMQRMIKHLE